ncbi:M23 family metallopeptidase [Candidatus Hydrogenosomobacter endosymbioticus]|uniref:LysM domain-containing protein n=1 Tax=Candidatus Hydrogenosomobacter endosymbioticus TaxID=2558174 RepID=A0ABM7V864_9PROT|nr:M23 family metallopeptidase [Candidatus Hydrogenosomobacter endosymbioticus]BDB95967.1 hypothetical protein HYD_1000 [Candidatus Hydrogenosomobacter endosymbioticus]
MIIEYRRKTKSIPVRLLILFQVLLTQCTLPLEQVRPNLGPYQVCVMKGESIYSIAAKNDISVRDLIIANRLEAPYAVSEGQVLVLPDSSSGERSNARSGESGKAISEGPELIPEPGPDRDSIDKVAAEVPPLSPIGGGFSSEKSGEVAAQAPRQQQPYQAQGAIDDDLSQELKKACEEDGRSTSCDSSSSKPASKSSQQSQKDKKQQSSAQKSPSAAPKDPVSFSLPARGKIVSTFQQKGRKKCNGVRIELPPGSSVAASSDGTVLFAGCELGHNLILIEHRDKFLTAYGNVSDIKVRQGQHVKKGQIIGGILGEKGATIHFEMRKDRKLVDPMAHIK